MKLENNVLGKVDDNWRIMKAIKIFSVISYFLIVSETGQGCGESEAEADRNCKLR